MGTENDTGQKDDKKREGLRQHIRQKKIVNDKIRVPDARKKMDRNMDDKDGRTVERCR